MSKAAIYVRVSSDEQVKGTSPDEQADVCRAYIEREGWELVGTFSDLGVSADPKHSGYALHERPGFAELLASGADIVIVKRLDRLVRHTEWFTFRDNFPGVRIVSLDGVDTARDDQLADGMRALFAADERRVIAERTYAGRLRRIERDGLTVGGHAPFGLEVVEQRFHVNEDEAETVRRAVDLVLSEGLTTTRDIAAALNAEGRLPRAWNPRGGIVEGRRWTTTGIRLLLRSEHLKGVYRWGSNKIELDCPALVSPEDWQALQEAMRGTRRRSYRSRRTYPLSGRLHVQGDETRHSLHGSSDTARGRQYFYYRCTSLRPTVNVRADEVERVVWEATTALLLDKSALLELIPTPLSDAETEAQASQYQTLTRKLAALETAQGRLEVQLAKGETSEGAAALARADLRREHEETAEHLARLETWRARSEEADARRDAVLSLADLDAVLADADLELQRHVYGVLDVQAVLVAPESVSVPDDPELRAQVMDAIARRPDWTLRGVEVGSSPTALARYAVAIQVSGQVSPATAGLVAAASARARPREAGVVGKRTAPGVRTPYDNLPFALTAPVSTTAG